MFVDSLDGTTEAGISEGEVVDVGVGPVLLSSVVHDFFESRVDNVFLASTAEIFHVRRVGRNNVAHHGEELLILAFLVLLGHATGSDMLKVLEPLEVRASDTASVGKHIGNDDHTLGIENFLSHESGGTVSAFKDNITVEKVCVVLVDRLLFGSGDQNVARFLHELSGIDCFNLMGMAVVSKCALAKHLSSDIIDV